MSVTKRVWARVASVSAIVGIVGTTACSGEPDATPETTASSSSSALIGGSDGTAAHPETGVLLFQPSNGVAGGSGTVTLVAPTLAAVAVHALAYVTFSGNSQGAGVVCGSIGVYDDKSVLTVTVGGQTRNVEQIINDGQTDICQGDLAFLVLDSPIENVAFPRIELDAPPAVNEGMAACGFGFVTTTCAKPSTAQCNDGTVLIASGGYYAPDFDQFPVGSVVTTNHTCSDDSGGLYSDSTGALMAVIGYNYNGDKTQLNTITNPCGDCAGSVTQGTLFSAHADFVARAFGTVGLAPPRQGHPLPVDIGGACTESLDCNSQLCVTVGSSGYCSQFCDSQACPSGSTCTPVDGEKVCLPTVTPDPASCTVVPYGKGSGRDGNGSALLYGIGLATLVVHRVRRRARAERTQR